MPNHITNRITIQAEGKQLEDILDTIKNDEIGRGSIDFNKLIPMPKSLDIMSGSETDRAISIYLTAINPEKPNMGCSKVRPYELIALEQGLNRHKHFASYKGDLSQDKIAEYTQYHPISHYLNLGKSAVDNFLQHGAITWYEWCINNWGTKWNAYGYDYMDYHPKENVLEYNTAWSNVPEILQVLSEKFPNVEFRYEYADEDIGVNVGRLDFLNGEVEYEDIPNNCSKEAFEMAFEIRGCSPEDYELVYSEESGTYEYQPELEMSME